MIIGVDIGSFATKTSKMINFESRVSSIGNLVMNDYEFNLNGEKYFIEEGTNETEYRKVLRNNYMKLLYSALVLSKCDRNIELVLGLPISQYREDKDRLIEMICRNSILRGEVNGNKEDYFIKKVDVYPEGVGAVSGGFTGIVVDIGGRTTDTCLITQHDNKRKIDIPGSEPCGTIGLYSNFIAVINSKYGLDLKLSDTERLLRNGLKIDGKPTDIIFAKQIFFNFIDDLINKLQVDYSLKTNDIMFTGGGSLLLEGIIKKRLPAATIAKNGVFANALAFERFGEEIWR